MENLSLDQLDVRLQRALAELFANDVFLLEHDVGERATTAKLSIYLGEEFPEYDVDVEYNRHGLNRDAKRVDLPDHCGEGSNSRIIPDIIVHRRGVDDQNLLVVECKMETNEEPRICDRQKIFAMKEELNYDYGLLLDLPSGQNAAERSANVEWF